MINPVPQKVTADRMQPSLEKQDRMTAIFSLHHQHQGVSPVSEDARFSFPLETIEQPFQRRLEFGPQPMPLLKDCWVTSPGYIVVTNYTGKNPTRNLTEEEKMDVAKRVLCIRADGDLGWLIVCPGRTIVFEYEPASSLLAWSKYDIASIQITVFPK